MAENYAFPGANKIWSDSRKVEDGEHPLRQDMFTFFNGLTNFSRCDLNRRRFVVSRRHITTRKENWFVRKLKYMVEDALWALGSFLYRINILGRMRDAEMVCKMQGFQVRILNETLNYGAGEHAVATAALDEIAKIVEGVNSPNGTTKKIGRIVTDVLNRLETGPEVVTEDTADLFTAANDAEETAAAA
mgnify:CR=1 FL=1